MALYDNRSLVLDRGVKRRAPHSFGAVGKRLGALLLGTGDPGPRGAAGALPAPSQDDAPTEDHRLASRFPLARRGYDRDAVDAYVAELEHELAAVDRELADARGGGAVADEVASELKRIGEQTSAVLLAAHQQRDEILRQARDEADRSVAQATATSNALTANCEQRLRELNAQNEAAQLQRTRLLDDLRTISAALVTVADSADQRLAAQPQAALTHT